MVELVGTNLAASAVSELPPRGHAAWSVQEADGQGSVDPSPHVLLVRRLRGEQDPQADLALMPIGVTVVRCQWTGWLVVPVAAQRHCDCRARRALIGLGLHQQGRVVSECFAHAISMSMPAVVGPRRASPGVW